MKNGLTLDSKVSLSCCVVVQAYGSAKGIIRTINSIFAQLHTCTVDVLILTEAGSETEAAIMAKLRGNPWLSGIAFAYDDVTNVYQNLNRNSNADYYLFLSPSDELLPRSLQSLILAAQTDSADAVFGACRWSDLKLDWSHPEVDAFFCLPSRISKFTAESLRHFSNTSVGLYSRRLFARSESEVSEPSKVFSVVHEYVCRRFYAGGPVAGGKYRLRAKNNCKYGTIASSSFPLPQRVTKADVVGTWLFGERGGTAAEDNGWALFEYCLSERSDLDCYYVLNSDSTARIPLKYQHKIIRKGSDEWREKLSQATHMLFTDSAEDILLAVADVFQHPNVHYIYLTHGYLGYFPGVYQKQHQYIDYVICSSTQDIFAATQRWGFPSSKFLICGLPRWDILTGGNVNTREILFCPSWRKEFDSSAWKSSEDPLEDSVNYFLSSAYYQTIIALLSSEELSAFLDEHDLRITFTVHFRLKKFLPNFSVVENDRIAVVSDDLDSRTLSQMLRDAALLITDYSSIMWDMAYMEKPVILFQYDKPVILGERELEQYVIADTDLPFDICHTESEIMHALNALSADNFGLSPGRFELLNRLLPNRAGGNSQRSINAILRQTVAQEKKANPKNEVCQVAPVDVYPSSKTAGEQASIKSLALITASSAACYENSTILSVDNWKEELADNHYDALIVEPFSTAKTDWGNKFFSIKETRQLLEGATVAADLANVPVTLSIPQFLSYGRQLEDLFPRFQHVAVNDQPYIEDAYDISVIIPTYNGEEYLPSAIDSVIDQKFFGRIQIVVVDDGSSDTTPSVIARYCELHENILAVKQENSRQGMARNQGMLAASGTYLTFLDSDDLLPAHALAELWNCVRLHNTKIAIGIGCSWQEAGANPKVNQSWFHYSRAPSLIDAERWPHVFYDPSCVGKLFKRSFLFDNNLFFPQSFHEDQAFCFKLFSLNEKMAVSNKIVYFYVARSSEQVSSGTQIFSTEKFRQILLAGTLASETLLRSTLNPSTKNHALGLLVLRYDRFLYKRAQAEKKSGSKSRSDEGAARNDDEALASSVALQLLQRLMVSIQDEVIVRHARYFPLVFLMTKRGKYDLAEEVYSGDSSNARAYLELSDERCLNSLDEVSETGRYDYFKAVPLAKAGGSVVTEMSYLYRLGALFVNAYKNPGEVWKTPAEAVTLAFDVVTGIGRKKQKAAEQERLESSIEALRNHSDFITATTAYQLGLALKEAITQGPAKIRRLPSRIKAIYLSSAGKRA